MRRFLSAALVAALFAMPMTVATSERAEACPDFRQWGDRYQTTGRELYTPRVVDVVAGGNNSLERCGTRANNYRGRLPGFVTTAPDFSINVSGLSGYQIEFRVEGSCDTVLLLNTAAANWYYDDDDAGNGQPKIRLTRPAANGIYDVWVGTYGPATCNARLIVETF